MIYVILWVIFSLGVAVEGSRRTCGFGYTLICSLLLSPLIGLLWVMSCERLIDIEFRRQQMEATMMQKMKDAAELHEKGLMSDHDFESMKLEYQNKTNANSIINPVGKILNIK